MGAFDTISMAFKNLYKRKIRTFLTVLGVVVGASAIIIMISLGLAINRGFEERMMGTPGATTIQLWNWGDVTAPVLDEAMFGRMMEIPGVVAATPWVSMWGVRSTIGRFVADLELIGVFPEALPYMGFELAEGRFLNSDDQWGIVFGAQVAHSYMTNRERADWRMRWAWIDQTDGTPRVNVLTDRIQLSVDRNFGDDAFAGVEDGWTEQDELDWETQRRAVRPHNVYGVGILAPGDSWESSQASFINLRTLQYLQAEQARMQGSGGGGSMSFVTVSGGGMIMGGGGRGQQDTGFNRGFVRARDVNAVEGVLDGLVALGFVENEHFWSPASTIRDLRDTMSSLQTLLGAMGIISLFIASIGISNTMIMSTVERTKEIGVMKVIGASLRDIRKLFLLESAIIGFFGGALGVAVSYIVSYVLNEVGLGFFDFLQMGAWHEQAEIAQVSIIPFWLSGLSLLFAAVIGLIAGFFPAHRATKLSALAAIRGD